MNPNKSNQNSKDLEAALTEAKKKIQGSREEIEAHEGLLRLALDDMRHIYDDLQKSQAQLVQADKLAAIGLLSAGIAHEINNPLGVIMLALEMIKLRTKSLKNVCENLPSQEKEKALELISDAEKMVLQSEDCANRMAAIVKDIKMFSRSDKGMTNPEDINAIIDSVIGIVWNAVKNKIELKKEYGKIPAVKCNAQQLSQVFMNLVVNAAQAMEGKGTIVIRTSVRDKMSVVEIADSGPGIPDDVKARIFEAFFTTKGPEKGTGLGLSISRDIVLKHGGTIEVVSEIGKGTTFTVCLPIQAG